mgnify:FL=1
MPKKVIYTREEIIEKAYEMFKSEGLNQITARTLAKKLKTSPAPIYGHFDSMEVLKAELIKKAREQFLSYVIKNYTDKPFLNAGMGFVIFAREESELFRAIFLMGNSNREIILEFKNVIFSEIEKDSRFFEVKEEKKDWLFNKCWTYAHGLATLMAMGLETKRTDEDIKNNLLDLLVFFDEDFLR